MFIITEGVESENMDHIAIMSKDFGNLIEKILNGSKKIESRWSKHKIAPWKKVVKGDIVYFKNTGKQVTACAEVNKILEFEDLNPKKIHKILDKWGKEDGINVENFENTYKWALSKKYCTLIFISNPKRVKPFKINKSGFGNGAAWMCVGNMERVKI